MGDPFSDHDIGNPFVDRLPRNRLGFHPPDIFWPPGNIAGGLHRDLETNRRGRGRRARGRSCGQGSHTIDTSQTDDRQSRNSEGLRHVGTYTDPHGIIWYGKKRRFVNMSFNTCQSIGQVGHVMKDDALTQCPELWMHFDLGLMWPKLFNQRCELEVFCHWHSIPVPKARSAELLKDQCEDNDSMLRRMERENNKMQIRLKRFHMILDAKKRYKPPRLRRRMSEILAVREQHLPIKEQHLSPWEQEISVKEQQVSTREQNRS